MWHHCRLSLHEGRVHSIIIPSQRTKCFLKVNRLFSKGKVEEALKASEKAELCSVRAFTCMLLFLLCQLLLFLTGIVLLICFAFDCIKTSCHW